MTDSTPLLVLTGFLGSGKTTLLREFLRTPRGARTLVLINEAGPVSLDHMLVDHVSEELLIDVGNGCACCAVRGDLVRELCAIVYRYLHGGVRPFDRLVIETSGLADPAPILATLMSDPLLRSHYALKGVVTTVDCALGVESLERNSEATAQVCVADLLVLTKSDLTSRERLESLTAHLQRLNPLARLARAEQGCLDANTLLDLDAARDHPAGLPPGDELAVVAPGSRPMLTADPPAESASTDAAPSEGSSTEAVSARSGTQESCRTTRRAPRRPRAFSCAPMAGHSQSIRTFSLVCEEPLDFGAFALWFAAFLEDRGSALLRVKGLLNVVGRTGPMVVHAAQHFLHPPTELALWPTPDRHTRIVFITRGIGDEAICRSFERIVGVSAKTTSGSTARPEQACRP